jgi:hypothetical protein
MPIAIMIIKTVFIKAWPVELLVKVKTLSVDCVKATPPNPIISIVIQAKKLIVKVMENISQKNL